MHVHSSELKAFVAFVSYVNVKSPWVRRIESLTEAIKSFSLAACVINGSFTSTFCTHITRTIYTYACTRMHAHTRACTRLYEWHTYKNGHLFTVIHIMMINIESKKVLLLILSIFIVCPSYFIFLIKDRMLFFLSQLSLFRAVGEMQYYRSYSTALNSPLSGFFGQYTSFQRVCAYFVHILCIFCAGCACSHFFW